LIARIAEAERDSLLGEIEGLQVSPAGAKDKIDQTLKRGSVDLGMPRVGQPAGGPTVNRA
jgi:hypothetical protein